MPFPQSVLKYFVDRHAREVVGGGFVACFGSCASSTRSGAGLSGAKMETMELRYHVMLAVAESIGRNRGRYELTEAQVHAFVEFVVVAVYVMGFWGDGSSSPEACLHGPWTRSEANRMWNAVGGDRMDMTFEALLPVGHAFGIVLTSLLGGLSRTGAPGVDGGRGKLEGHEMKEVLEQFGELTKGLAEELLASIPAARRAAFNAAMDDPTRLLLSHINTVLAGIRLLQSGIVELAVNDPDGIVRQLVLWDRATGRHLGLNNSTQPDW